MTEDAPERSYAEIEAERFRKELPGTIGCVTTYAFISLVACSMFIPLPYGLIAAALLVLLYVGAIVTFGQGSILEMGVMAIILLILSCLCGRIVDDIEKPMKPTPTSANSGG